MSLTAMNASNFWLTLLAALLSLVYLKSWSCTPLFGIDLCHVVPSNASSNWTEEPAVDHIKYYHEDYEKYMNVFVIHHSITGTLDFLMQANSIKEILDNHNIYEDEDYLKNKDYYDKNKRLYSDYIDLGGEKDRRFYCSYISKEKGYGIFADLDIQKGSVIGVYTGIITNETANKDYAWIYQSYPVVDGKKMDISIDSRVYGNFLRFVNHNDDPNTKSIAVPYKNRWHRVYVAIKPIQKGEEVTVSYGSYWKTREYIKV